MISIFPAIHFISKLTAFAIFDHLEILVIKFTRFKLLDG